MQRLHDPHRPESRRPAPGLPVDKPATRPLDHAFRIDPALDFLPRTLLGRSEARLIRMRASAQGVGADETAVAEGYVDEKRYYRALADHLGLPFIDRPVDLVLPAGREAFRAGAAPAKDTRTGFVLAPTGRALRSLLSGGRSLSGAAVTTPSLFAESLLRTGDRRLAIGASERLARRAPALSSRVAVRPLPCMILFGCAMLIAAIAFAGPDDPRVLLSALLAACFVPGAVLKLAAGAAGAFRTKEPAPLSDRALPRWSVIVALHREERVVERLVRSLRALDYPAAKLDVLFAVERHDAATIRALRGTRLPPNFRILICPPGLPRTKPRALNIAFAFCRGDYVTVYDAEDEPDPGQLRAAASAFASGPPELACLQSRLAVDNADDGRLEKSFALEYAALFDRIVPGLARFGLPVPLGGTSNHFRRRALDKVLAWDAWNVTEDADLGLRLARLGFKVSSLRSDTWEEAPVRLGGWIKQRSRWLKGWMQTGMVHLRDPAGLIRRIGFVPAIVVAVHTWGTVFAALFAPLAAFAAVRHAAAVWSAGRGVDAATLYFGVIALLGVIAYLVPVLLAARDRGLAITPGDLAFMPIHLLLVCAAAWFALAELVRAPSHWHKTDHGFALRRRRTGEEISHV